MKVRRLPSLILVTLLLACVAPAASDPALWAEGEGRPVAIFPEGHVFHLELARTPEERARGYMFRERISPDEGMLFLFGQEGFHSFWMKDCRVSLDLVWLSGDLKVVHLEKEVPPCRREPCPSYFPMRKGRFVLEIRGGMAEKTGLKVGDPVRVEGVDLEAEVPP